MLNFSIITPIYSYNEEKTKELLRCIESVNNLDYPHDHIEHVIVNDGSIVPIDIPKYPHIKVINQENKQRVLAYQKGFEEATGDWYLMLDADDELKPETLKTINKWHTSYNGYKMFNFGCEYHHKDGRVSVRDSFKPGKKDVGHEVFGGGNIVNGTFVFDAALFDIWDAFPHGEIKQVDCSEINYPAGGDMVRDLTMSSPYDFSAWAQLTFPEIRKYFMVNVDSEPNKIIKELGNPWGQDFLLFFKYTRHYKSKPFDEHLLIVHPR